MSLDINEEITNLPICKNSNKVEFEKITRELLEKSRKLRTNAQYNPNYKVYDRFNTFFHIPIHILDSLNNKACFQHKCFAIESMIYLTPEKVDKFIKLTPTLNTEENRQLKEQIIELWTQLLKFVLPQLGEIFIPLFEKGAPHTENYKKYIKFFSD